MTDIEQWFKEGRILTFTTRVTDTDKVANFIREMNSADKPVSESIGFQLESWAMYEVHKEMIREKYISCLVIEDIIKTGETYGLELLISESKRAITDIHYPDKVNLQLVDLNVLESRLEALKGKVIEDSDINHLLEAVRSNKHV